MTELISEFRCPALALLKREVKQLMEESVMKKFVSEESPSVIALCVAVEACFVHGLKCRVFGLFSAPRSSLSLLYKIADLCPPAASILKMVIRIEKQCFEEQKRSSFDRLNESPINLLSRQKEHPNLRYLWIKLALFEKVLVTIVDYVSRNARKYYDKGALMLDSSAGSMIATLLMGPCALDYSKAKTLDNYFCDPPADELLQRHRIHSKNSPGSQLFTGKSPRTLQIKRIEGLGPDDASQKTSNLARDHVMSLHQNTASTLLYGKNNVCVYSSNDCARPMRGYLSLHETYDGSSIIKWMPNELVHSKSDAADFFDASNAWNNAICLNISELVYIHVHNKGSEGGIIVFIGADGVQYAPLHFPPGQHPLAFISCIENSIEPWGQLAPPLWLRNGFGKVFPKLRRRSSSGDMHHKSSDFEDTKDYVFRIQRRKFSSTNGASSVGDRYYASSVTSPAPSIAADSSASRFERFSSHLRQRWRSAVGVDSSRASYCGASPPETPSRSTATSSVASRTPSSPRFGDFLTTTPDEATARFSTPSDFNAMPVSSVLSDESPLFISPDLSVSPAGVSTSPLIRDVTPPSHILVSQTSSPARLFVDDGDEPAARLSLKSVCNSMRHQILRRAFCGWLAHCKNMCTVRTHLRDLVKSDEQARAFSQTVLNCEDGKYPGLTGQQWRAIRQTTLNESSFDECCLCIYLGGVQKEIRHEVWPYLLGFHKWSDDEATAAKRLHDATVHYENLMTEWMAVDAVVRKRDLEIFRIATENQQNKQQNMPKQDHEEICNGIEEFEIDGVRNAEKAESMILSDDVNFSTNDALLSPFVNHSTPSNSKNFTISCQSIEYMPRRSINGDVSHSQQLNTDHRQSTDTVFNNNDVDKLDNQLVLEHGETYSKDLADLFAINIHRIDKDVHRCDRNYSYFASKRNLEKLRNVMCTYVWEHLETGYIQGMCDLAAPLLVIFNDEVLAYGCFVLVMNRLAANFPHRQGMDVNLTYMKSLLQVMDPELSELILRNGDANHFYFCFRWFLLDFKRELAYEDIFLMWETIWAANRVASSHFILFVALATIETYRDIILQNNMDFTDIIKFFNEMAEHHEAKPIISLARAFVSKLQVAFD